MKHFGKFSKTLVVGAICLCANLSLVKGSQAGVGQITLPDLEGDWQISLVGFTGCGQHSMLVTVSLDASGNGLATINGHGQCGDSITDNQTFNIISLDSSGTGKANLSCGAGCGWNFDIQVSPDRGTFNLVDVDPVNPGNYLSGTAIHR